MSNVGQFTSRGKCMEGVMANQGFGDLVIMKTGVTVIVPQQLLNKSTRAPKKNIQAKLIELTRENVSYLEDKGVKISVGL